MNLYIKNMVCVRCKMAVKVVLEKLEIDYQEIELGKVTISKELDTEQKKKLNDALKHYELELMDNKKNILVERIKTLITEMFHSPDDEMQLKLTYYLSKRLKHEYAYLSNIFSEAEKTTIERFYISTRVQRVKELLVYEELSIKEITYQLNYSSISHLCLQFKKVTGQTPSEYKKQFQSNSLDKSKNDITYYQNNIAE
jgi:AraC family transcriptional regulator